MKLYFGNVSSIISILLIVGVFIYMFTTIKKQNEISSWEKRITVLALAGLLICIFAAARDGYYSSVQASIDHSTLPGVFTAGSIQSTLCSLVGAVIAFSIFSSIFVKKQWYRKTMFFILSSVIIFKVFVIEISRIFIA